EFFYSQKNENLKTEQTNILVNNEKVNEETETLKKEDKTFSYLENLTPQFNYIFENYPQNKELISLIENSNFVEINNENSSYSIGAIYKDNKIKYLCYAVKSTYNTPAPSELGEHYQWLPIDKSDPLTDGYYLVFQDAQDLKILEL
ncbi:MAG: hypothetical protein IJD48_00095, partial [Clostridia bacterium]|nr:hypothetical protein [Clostridia bacterium]